MTRESYVKTMQQPANRVYAPESVTFAANRGLSCARGSGAPGNPAWGLALSVLAMVVGVFVLLVAPAVAAAEKPLVESEFVSGVLGEQATLNAVVNPNGESKCHVQYGLLSVSENEAFCGSVEEKGTRSREVFGLVAGMVYQYRFIFTNASGTTEGAVQEFTAGLAPETPELEVEPTGTAVKLRGVLNPNSPGNAVPYKFLYAKSASECMGGGNTPEQLSTGELHEQVETEVTGLSANTVYTFCLQASTGEGAALSAPRTATTLTTPPGVSEQSVSNVGSVTATLHAKVDPGGAPTTYFFQYGTSTAYGSTTPVTGAGGGSEPTSVLANIEGLSAGTVYHFRVVASNANGTAEGEDVSFRTFPAGELRLPDNRGFELVSRLNNGDATVLPGVPEQASPDGSTVAYRGNTGLEGGNGNQGGGGGIRAHGTVSYLARRSAAGWAPASIQPDGRATADFQGFSSDLSVGVLGSEQALIEGEPDAPAMFSRTAGDGSYRKLLGEKGQYAGSTADGGHILINSNGTLYDSVAGQPEAVSVLPGGGVPARAVFGSPEGDLERVISSDGSRVFWSAVSAGHSEALYVRENDTSPEPRTVQVDAAEPACLAASKCVSGGGVYRTASVDGSRVLFTDENRLTGNSTAEPGKPDLYEYQVNPEPGQPGTLTDLTANPAEPANVVGVLGASADGSYVYFAAAGSLLNGVAPQECLPVVNEQEDTTKCNVYVVHEQKVQLVTAVSFIDGEGGRYHVGEVRGRGDWVANLGERTAHVTPDGRHLAFWSTEALTGFSGGGPEIYMYDYGASLTCISCNPTGVPTHPVPYTYYVQTNLPESSNPTYQSRVLSTDASRMFFESGEALVSQFPNVEARPPVYTGGFPTGGLANVYEWERPASVPSAEPNNSCTRESSSFSAADGGCLYLLSGGTSSDSSFFVDASETGEDVFLETRAQLVPQDEGETYELYDARVGATGQPAAPACTGTGCQGVPGAPPIFATPASATFNGTGNFPPQPPGKPKSAAEIRAEKLAAALKACRRHRVRSKRVACERSARRKYRNAKASYHRRAAR